MGKKYRILYDMRAHFEELPKAYRRIRQALGIIRLLAADRREVCVGELGVYNLFHLEEDRGELCAYLEKYIKPLLESREENLLQTMQAFVQSFYNYSAAARKLYLHSNTVRYRIGLAERLCGIDLSNFKQRFEMELSLQWYELRELLEQGILQEE